ncbi:unnamed protein product [Onchocerca flexuosa]|uniref:Protein kinase domain-containing protein n=1 Tax=Onchocerca flexuosa TaxID=387005 RepID=A0A183HG29_9BILA|nr:unnamed protein product [Onchocerca flexuosa]
MEQHSPPNDVQGWIDDVYQARSVEATSFQNLFQTLYVGESMYGLFAFPAFIDSRTITIVPKYLGPPLLEGPAPIVVENEDPQAQSSGPSTRPIALINLDIAKITHKTVDGEFLVLGMCYLSNYF